MLPKHPLVVTFTEEEALAHSYTRLTYPIDPTTEAWILDNVLGDLLKGSIPCVVVKQSNGYEVWRKVRSLV